MNITTEILKHSTKGTGDLVDITSQISQLLDNSKLKSGIATIFVVGSTAAITTFEYEPGLIKDVQDLCEKLIPRKARYAHDETWGDANGFSHLRASLFSPSLSIPFTNGQLVLGTWQQVVLAEFDTRPRNRQVIVQFMGE
ncbi:MAG: secondary thiamine-phosphate synthase enzyme YjbQ [Candidatus Omnitrophica bacterium]|nr:secondary thiamine-phosphate synthase enzyme YjbQ [Candidatus Omnitrophota bacterium]